MRLDVAAVEIMYPPGHLLLADQVPDEAPEAVVQDFGGARRPPDVV